MCKILTVSVVYMVAFGFFCTSRSFAGDEFSSVVKLETASGEYQASGFVVCVKHHLLATAGHVADSFQEGDMVKITFEASNKFYKIEKIWYHPLVLRELDFGLKVFSSSANDGDIVLPGPDVAILRFTEKFPSEIKECALSSTIHKGMPVKVAGFPSPTDEEVPNESSKMQVAFGNIKSFSSLSDLLHGIDERKSWIGSMAGFGPGGSGSPLFDESNGIKKTVGMLVNSKIDETTLESSGYEYASSVLIQDILSIKEVCLCSDKFPDGKSYIVNSDLNSFDRGKREAYECLRRAEIFLRDKQFKSASDECNSALALCGTYRHGFLLRSRIYMNYCGFYWDKLDINTKTVFSKFALDDASYCLTLGEVRGASLLALLSSQVYYYYAANLNSEALQLAKLIGDKTSHYESIMSLEQIALCRSAQAQACLLGGDLLTAEKFYDYSIKIAPDVSVLYKNRAIFYSFKKDFQRANADLSRSLIIDSTTSDGKAISP